MKRIAVPKVQVKAKIQAKLKVQVPAARSTLVETLAAMPDEAFGWLVASIASGGIWPSGLGGFLPASRTSIEEARKAAIGIMRP